MNVFVLPSWYPSGTSPAAGVFVREQVLALARERQAFQFTVAGWGHLDGALSLRDPARSARALAWRLRHCSSVWRELAPRVHELTTPALSWTLGLAGGGAGGLLRASRRNLALATERFGRPALIHAHVGYPAGWIAACLSRETLIPFVVTEHMSPFPFPALAQGSGHGLARLRWASERAQAVIAVSPSLADQMRQHGVRCTHNIPNLVDTARLTCCLSPQAPPFTFFSLGGPSPQKGTDLLLRALQASAFPAGQVRLVIGGGGDEAGHYARLAQYLGVANAVDWLGPVSPVDVPRRMAECHAFVLASRHESFGVVLIEALASGRPVIATCSGGPAAIVHAGNGLLVKVEDVPALTAALQWMVTHAQGFDPATLRADAEARFGSAAVARRIAAVYDEVGQP